MNPRGSMIRHWTDDDLKAVQHILLETWRDAYGSFIPETDLETYFQTHYHMEAMRKLLAAKGVDGLVAELNGETVGFARTAYDPAEKRFTIASLYVLPEHQGKGIGMELLLHAEKIGAHYGVDSVWLGVMEENARALSWYQRIGFTFLEVAPFVMGSSTVRHLIGYRPLKHPPSPPGPAGA